MSHGAGRLANRRRSTRNPRRTAHIPRVAIPANCGNPVGQIRRPRRMRTDRDYECTFPAKASAAGAGRGGPWEETETRTFGIEPKVPAFSVQRSSPVGSSPQVDPGLACALPSRRRLPLLGIWTARSLWVTHSSTSSSHIQLLDGEKCSVAGPKGSRSRPCGCVKRPESAPYRQVGACCSRTAEVIGGGDTLRMARTRRERRGWTTNHGGLPQRETGRGGSGRPPASSPCSCRRGSTSSPRWPGALCSS